MKTLFLLLLSSTCFAASLDLPGYFSSRYDYRFNNSTDYSDNRTGRLEAYGEQGISTKALKDYIQGYVGYNLYAPNLTAADNYGILGIRNKSLFNPLVVSFEYQHPIVQVSDQVNRFVVLVSYEKGWNLAR
jgi:hypothetical protein